MLDLVWLYQAQRVGHNGPCTRGQTVTGMLTNSWGGMFPLRPIINSGVGALTTQTTTLNYPQFPRPLIYLLGNNLWFPTQYYKPAFWNINSISISATFTVPGASKGQTVERSGRGYWAINDLPKVYVIEYPISSFFWSEQTRAGSYRHGGKRGLE